MNLVKTLHALQNRIHSKFSHSLASSADRRKSHLMQISLAVQIHRKVQGLLIYQVLATTPQLTPAVPSLYPNWTRSKSVYPLARPYPLHSSWPTRVRDCLTLWIIGSSYRWLIPAQTTGACILHAGSRAVTVRTAKNIIEHSMDLLVSLPFLKFSCGDSYVRDTAISQISFNCQIGILSHKHPKDVTKPALPVHNARSFQFERSFTAG